MKKINLLIAVLILSLSVNKIQAQAFDKSTKLITIAIGAGEMVHFPIGSSNPYVNNGYLNGFNINRLIITGQLSIQGEFAVHKYVGVGFVIGVGGCAESLPTYNGFYGITGLGTPKEVNIPIGLLANFHFYQLIADKNKKGSKLHADKLDIYAGITAGSGVAIHPYGQNDTHFSNTPFNDALFFFGPHAGVNYYFTKSVAVHGEVGWGVTIVQAGIAFKLGK